MDATQERLSRPLPLPDELPHTTLARGNHRCRVDGCAPWDLLSWLLLAALVSAIALLAKVRLPGTGAKKYKGMVSQCFFIGLYVATWYFWLNEQLAINGLLAAITLSFVGALYHASYDFVADILAKNSGVIENTELAKSGKIAKYSQQNKINYPHDPATNLPRA